MAASGEEPLAEEVASWLTLLNQPEFGLEPLAYAYEQTRVKELKETYPNFSKAATSWPQYAERHWATVGSQVCHLFQVPRSFNFVQWTIEYVKQTTDWKSYANNDSSQPDAQIIIDLTEALCSGILSPLHVAAALGLPSLCRAILAERDKESDFHNVKVYGTALSCSLIGPNFLKSIREPRMRSQASQTMKGLGPPADRAATIRLFMDLGLKDTLEYHDTYPQIAPVAFYVFWNALLTSDESLFDSVATKVESLDQRLIHFLKAPPAVQLGQPAAEIYTRLLTRFYDDAFVIIHGRTVNTEAAEALRRALGDLMSIAGMEFKTVTPGRVHKILDAQFTETLWTAILEDDLWLVKRLTQDPRFDRDMVVGGEDDESPTLLHLAVAGDHTEVVDVLIGEGSSLTVTDRAGRKPLMVVESTTMLSELVHRHKDTTTHTDNDGKTIWHYAAATHDATLLRWLCLHDPSKKINMLSSDKDDQTPLAEALFYVRFLQTEKRSPVGTTIARPEPVLHILQAYQDLQCYTGINRHVRHLPIGHLVASWGHLDVVEKLVDIGEDFRSVDMDGRTALHCISLSAPPDLAKLLAQACKQLPIADKRGNTPAETIFLNTALNSQKDSEDAPAVYHLSAHPSCNRPLSLPTYHHVLSKEVLAYHDARGRGTWERFCAVVVLANSIRGYEKTFLKQSLKTATALLITRGALKDYERESGRCGIYCLEWADRSELLKELKNEETGPREIYALEDTETGKPQFHPEGLSDHDFEIHWPTEISSILHKVLKSSDKELVKAFCQSPQAVELFCMASMNNSKLLMRTLCENGVSPFAPSAAFGNRTAFELNILASCEKSGTTCLEMLLENAQASELMTLHEKIFENLIHGLRQDAYSSASHDTRDRQLVLLLRKGLPANPINLATGEIATEKPSFLVVALMQGFQKAALSLLVYGADPAVGQDGLNAAMAAVMRQQGFILEKIIDRVGYDFDWSVVSTYRTPQGIVRTNMLSESLRGDNVSVLEMLLKRTALRNEVNARLPRGGEDRLMHLAASCGRLEHLMVLAEYGCDFAIRGDGGETALIVAVRHRGNYATVLFLLGVCDPDGKDAQGKTAKNWARESGNADIIELLENGRDDAD